MAQATLVKRLRYRLEALLLQGLGLVVERLPRNALQALAKMLTFMVFHLDKRGRTVALDNIEYTGINTFSNLPKEHIARRSMGNLVRSWLDMIWFSRHVNAQNYGDFFELADQAGVRELEEGGQPIVYCTFHYGNFEFTSHFMGYYGRGTVVVQQETKNPAIGKFLTRFRIVGKNRPISRTGAMLRLLKTLKAGGNIGLLADLTLPPEQPSAVVEFLGLKMCVTRLNVELACRTGAPLVMIMARPLPDGRYRVETCPPIYLDRDADVPAAVQQCINHLESLVKDDPTLWMWAYKHFRYQDPQEPERYPPYANPKKAFAKKMRLQQAENPAEH